MRKIEKCRRCVEYEDEIKRLQGLLNDRERTEAIERFLQYLPNRPKDGCWEWQGGRSTNGYGKSSYKGYNAVAHRIAILLLTNDNLFDGEVVMHLCHNRLCCNPEHLKVGSQQENVQMDIDRGIKPSHIGLKNPNAKATPSIVREMRQLHKSGRYTYYRISKMYEMSLTQVKNICRRLQWQHIV